MDLYDLIESTRFVGAEFVTWLWFRSDVDNGLLSLPDHGTVECWFEGTLTMSNQHLPKEVNTVRCDDPTQTAEARTALRAGKKVEAARIRFVKEQKEWVFNVKSRSLALSGLKLPELLGREEDDRFYERVFLIEEVESIFFTTYQQFLELRLDEDRWRQEMERIHQWVEGAAGVEGA